MLEFNPYFRKAAKNLLKCSYFDDIRDPALEKDAEFTITLP